MLDQTTATYPPNGTQRVAISGTSAQSTAVTTTEGLVCLHNGDTSVCFVTYGTNPTAVATDSLPLAPGEKFHMRIPSGSKIAVIGTAGYLYVTPCG